MPDEEFEEFLQVRMILRGIFAAMEPDELELAEQEITRRRRDIRAHAEQQAVAG